MGSILAIANQKGGVGKTTTAVNLGASLAAAERSCLLVDCDPQGNATTALGFNRAGLGKSVYDVIMSAETAEEAVARTVLPGFFLIGANADLIGAEVEMAAAQQREFRLRRKLSTVRGNFDYILLDCPPSLGFLTLNALTAADGILVPLQCEYYALEGLSQLLKTVRAVKRSLNPSLELAGIVLTMYDGRNNLALQVAEEVRRHFREGVFETVIPRNVRLSEAPSHGKPALLYDVRSTGAQSYLALAREVIQRGAVAHV